MRNRIIRHIRIRAGDLVPHELNPRVHSEAQAHALRLLYDKIGFARSLLAYPLADGRFKLIDGHLRATLTPDEELDVEVLDVNDAEARALLLAIDPLAQIAGYDPAKLDNLRTMVEADSAAVKSLMQLLAEASAKTERAVKDLRDADHVETFLVMIECEDEAHQRKLLARFKDEGLTCHAKMG